MAAMMMLLMIPMPMLVRQGQDKQPTFPSQRRPKRRLSDESIKMSSQVIQGQTKASPLSPAQGHHEVPSTM